jgi:hypothetical protein
MSNLVDYELDKDCKMTTHHYTVVHRACSYQNSLDMPPADQLDVNHTLEDLMDALEVGFHSDL